jgi:hypothetical protein
MRNLARLSMLSTTAKGKRRRRRNWQTTWRRSCAVNDDVFQDVIPSRARDLFLFRAEVKFVHVPFACVVVGATLVVAPALL